MATIAKHFDVLDYVEQAKALGVDERVAKHQARQMEHVIDIAVNAARTDVENKELATKSDIKALEALIYKSKSELIIWVTGLLIASGLIQHFFK